MNLYSKVYNKNINTIFLIGNGFDIAHGLPTSYENFILDLISTKIDYKYDKSNIKHEIQKLGDTGPIITSFLSSYNNNLIRRICSSNMVECKWFDIERMYFSYLHSYIRNNNTDIDKYIKIANNEFKFLKDELYLYLKDVQNNMKLSLKKEIKGLLNIYKSNINNYTITFNYTNTFEYYLPYIRNDNNNYNHNIIYINGRILDNDLGSDNLIFGYGDEHSSRFETIKEHEEALLYLKSIDYSLRPEYMELMSALSETFNLVILGHSCGISDRSLISLIVNHQNLNQIIIRDYNNETNKLCLLRLKQYSENGKIFNANIDRGLCQHLVM